MGEKLKLGVPTKLPAFPDFQPASARFRVLPPFRGSGGPANVHNLPFFTKLHISKTNISTGVEKTAKKVWY